MKIGDRIFVRGYIDEIRKDTVIVRNDGGYFGTIPSEVITGELPSAQPEKRTDERTETHACDLISRQALCEYALNQKDKIITANDIMRFPSAQPEIIHCKDCDYRYGRYCHYRYTYGLFISADHYCGYAVRREDKCK